MFADQQAAPCLVPWTALSKRQTMTMLGSSPTSVLPIFLGRSASQKKKNVLKQRMTRTAAGIKLDLENCTEETLVLFRLDKAEPCSASCDAPIISEPKHAQAAAPNQLQGAPHQRREETRRSAGQALRARAPAPAVSRHDVPPGHRARHPPTGILFSCLREGGGVVLAGHFLDGDDADLLRVFGVMQTHVDMTIVEAARGHSWQINVDGGLVADELRRGVDGGEAEVEQDVASARELVGG